MSCNDFHQLTQYVPPTWTKHLDFIPTHKVKLSMTPTPIHQWNIPWLPDDMELYIKRDDLTGHTLSGCKVRKLEFQLAEALKLGCKSVITCGPIQSNHCRTTAVAASELGLDCHLLLKSDNKIEMLDKHPGNVLLDVFSGSKIYITPLDTKPSQFIQKQRDLAIRLQETTGHKPWEIAVGGSDLYGLYGYIEALREMIEQDVLENFDDVVITSCSGGSAAGLAIANHLTGNKVKLHTISTANDSVLMTKHIKEMFDCVGLGHLQVKDVIDIIDGYQHPGYSKTTNTDQEQIADLISKTGIFCDPVYTWKGLKGTIGEFKRNRNRFKGKRILFIHTAAAFSFYDFKMQEMFFTKFNENIEFMY